MLTNIMLNSVQSCLNTTMDEFAGQLHRIAPTVSDPNGAISFFDAIRKQLGLKIVKEKRPEPVLVIDSISEKPTEN